MLTPSVDPEPPDYQQKIHICNILSQIYPKCQTDIKKMCLQVEKNCWNISVDCSEANCNHDLTVEHFNLCEEIFKMYGVWEKYVFSLKLPNRKCPGEVKGLIDDLHLSILYVLSVVQAKHVINWLIYTFSFYVNASKNIYCETLRVGTHNMHFFTLC